MKITDDMLTEWRKQFEDWWARDVPPEYSSLLPLFLKSNENGEYKNPRCQGAWEVWQAARRTTPDREAIIEECAKVCEMERDALRKNEAIWDANPNLRPDEDYVSEWEASACRGEEYAAAIRALKTAPTSDQGEKS
ncbi:hypothetical protein [Burkholderia multivorans]|uniref:hypothetical protein n=1 Tax=Burkholderia multivorans TaxID=87883 RepID=UPI0020B27A65|nr:hypothetical protein [Burkholderia multivorans]